MRADEAVQRQYSRRKRVDDEELADQLEFLIVVHTELCSMRVNYTKRGRVLEGVVIPIPAATLENGDATAGCRHRSGLRTTRHRRRKRINLYRRFTFCQSAGNDFLAFFKVSAYHFSK